ncbi:hypothetical protein HBH87_020960 [Parastagonospora nodorum]|nr:hypothetical protein HBI02_035810 [Parastagonospora nodorum]KAH4533946.1 hypothetical protein HBH87_020960 [Parastagonospora nodorum]KAH5982306.1 hypothetical protein HBI87_007650 [Parastagonospora nodorum]
MAATVNPAASSTIAPAQLQIFDHLGICVHWIRILGETLSQFLRKSYVLPSPSDNGSSIHLPIDVSRNSSAPPAQLSVFAIGLPGRSIEELNDLSYKVPHPFQMVTDRTTEQQVGAVRVVHINLHNHLDEFFVCEIELLKEQSKGSSNRFDVFPLARLTGLKHVGVRLVDPYFSPWDPMCLQKEPMKASVKRTVKNMGVHKDVQISVDLGRQYTPHERLPS